MMSSANQPMMTLSEASPRAPVASASSAGVPNSTMAAAVCAQA